MTSRRALGPLRLDSLGTRLAALLTLAILPLGLIVVLQTYRVLDEAEQKTNAALLGQTLRAVRPERGAIQEAIGSAEGLGVAVLELIDDPAACSAVMDSFTRREASVNFASFRPVAGVMTCASEGTPPDFADAVNLAPRPDGARVAVRVSDDEAATVLPALLVSAPVYSDDEELLGTVVLSIVLEPILLPDTAAEGEVVPSEVLTFNPQGEILTSSTPLQPEQTRLPLNRSLRAFVGGRPAVFRDVDASGSWHIYTVTPLIDDTVYAMAIWPNDAGVGEGGLWRWTVPTVVLPFLMWATSLAVAFFAVHRLVIRHVRHLRKRMRLFSRFRRIEDEPSDTSLPTELREVTDSFVAMAHTIIRDEAEQEDSIREKDALLREIYHRVRNNLQLVASINNMQTRAARSQEAKHVLRRLQDRIMALATIHGSLYEADALSKVRVDPIIEELTTQIASKARDVNPEMDIRTQTQPLMLHPDQAVPLALLVVEALTNAVKHVGRAGEGTSPYVLVAISAARSDEDVVLSIENSVGEAAPAEPSSPAHEGLGMQLMEAFTVQLGGTKEVTVTETVYRLTVRFRATHYGDKSILA